MLYHKKIVGQGALENPKTVSATSIDTGCTSQLDGKNILLKTAHALSAGPGEIRLGLKWKSSLFFLLDFVMLEGATKVIIEN